MYFLIPFAIFWSLIFPLYCLIRIVLNKKKLNEPQLMVQLGFFYIGYKSKFYFWEFVIMSRKISTIYITLLPDSLIFSKAILILLLIAVSFFYHAKNRPYTNDSLNKLELNAILVSILTIFFGIFHLTNIGDVMKAFLFIIIILINLFFFLNWAYLLLIHFYKKVAKSKKMESAKKFFFKSSKYKNQYFFHF